MGNARTAGGGRHRRRRLELDGRRRPARLVERLLQLLGADPVAAHPQSPQARSTADAAGRLLGDHANPGADLPGPRPLPRGLGAPSRPARSSGGSPVVARQGALSALRERHHAGGVPHGSCRLRPGHRRPRGLARAGTGGERAARPEPERFADGVAVDVAAHRIPRRLLRRRSPLCQDNDTPTW